jgi:hypothetical protein
MNPARSFLSVPDRDTGYIAILSGISARSIASDYTIFGLLDAAVHA